MKNILDIDLLDSRLKQATLWAFFTFFMLISLLFIDRRKYQNVLIGSILLLHILDTHSYKFSEIALRTTPLNQDQYKILNFQAIPYPPRRDRTLLTGHPREKILTTLSVKGGVNYWTTYALLFKDEVGVSALRVMYWLIPWDNFLRAYQGQSIHDMSVPLAGLRFGTTFAYLVFPLEHPASGKMAGLTEDKIQFFTDTLFLTDDAIAINMTHPDYKGDIPLLSSSDDGDGYSHSLITLPKELLATNARLSIPYKVQKFSSNHLNVTVNIPGQKQAWMFYSDVWHPRWRATVNGKPTQIFKVNLAYKGIKLIPGTNEIHFFFQSKLMTFLQYLFALNALIWLGILFLLILNILRHRDSFPKIGISTPKMAKILNSQPKKLHH